MSAPPDPAPAPAAVPAVRVRLGRRFWHALLVFTAAPLAALLLGWALGWLAWPALLLVGLATLAGCVWLLAGHARQVRGLIGFVEQFRRAPDLPLADPPAPRVSLLTAELAATLVETTRERQRRRRELEALIAGNEAILASLPYPLMTLTGAQRVSRANPAAEVLFEGTLAGRDLVAVVRDPDLLAAVAAVLAGEGDRTLEFAVAGSVTRSFVAHVARLPAPLLDESAAILALLDVTALKRAEQMRADFVANASHELKTPLASLLGFIETLRGPARDDAEARVRFLGIMQEQAERMARLIDDLLSLSRIEMEEHVPPTASADLRGLLQAVAASLQLRAERRGITLVLQMPDDLPAVPGERDELAQVFQNLVDNALKYGRPGTPVTIRAWSLGPAEEAAQRLGRPAVAVAVADQGEGIAREHLPRLTERFYRVDTARSRAMGGTGLGLAIVKHVVSRHRGLLEIDSAPGRGSTFTVYLRAKGLTKAPASA